MAGVGDTPDGADGADGADGPSWGAPGQAVRLVLVPDLDDELCEVLRQVEELLLTLSVWEEDPDSGPGPFVLPPALAGRIALDALHRVQDVVHPTQSRSALGGHAAPPRGRLLGPDGRYEHMPLRPAEFAATDLDALAAAAAELGRAVAISSELAEAIAAGAADAAPTCGPAPTPTHLVEALARAHGVLDLAVNDDTRTLHDALAHPAPGGDVVLDARGEAAYQRYVERLNTMWTSGDPISRWLY